MNTVKYGDIIGLRTAGVLLASNYEHRRKEIAENIAEISGGNVRRFLVVMDEAQKHRGRGALYQKAVSNMANAINLDKCVADTIGHQGITRPPIKARTTLRELLRKTHIETKSEFMGRLVDVVRGYRRPTMDLSPLIYAAINDDEPLVKVPETIPKRLLVENNGDLARELSYYISDTDLFTLYDLGMLTPFLTRKNQWIECFNSDQLVIRLLKNTLSVGKVSAVHDTVDIIAYCAIFLPQSNLKERLYEISSANKVSMISTADILTTEEAMPIAQFISLATNARIVTSSDDVKSGNVVVCCHKQMEVPEFPGSNLVIVGPGTSKQKSYREVIPLYDLPSRKIRRRQ